MIPKPTDRIKDQETRDLFDYLLEEGVGKILILSAAPTAGTPLLSDQERGIYNNIFYVREGGKIHSFTPTATITIT